MHYRVLGKTGLNVSLLGLGTGGPSSLGQSANLALPEQIALIRRCFDLGVNFFDTSSRYGKSEEILGSGLAGMRRESYVVCTKWSAAGSWSPQGIGGEDGPLQEDPEALSRAVEESLRRLRTDYIDILQFHGLRWEQYLEVVERFGPVMERLRQQGKIRFNGFSERFIADPKHEVVTLALRTHPDLWDTVMLKYGILNQYAAKEALPLALKSQVGVVNMAAVRIKLPRKDLLEALIREWKERGLISGDCVPDTDPLGWLVRDGVTSVIGAGYKFAADHPAIGTVLTGTSSQAHLAENAAALVEPYLPESDKQRLRGLFGAIGEYA